MLTFAKGFMVDGKFISEGSEVKATTIQGIVVEGVLASSAKKKVGIQLSGELEVRVFEVDAITEMAEVDEE